MPASLCRWWTLHIPSHLESGKDDPGGGAYGLPCIAAGAQFRHDVVYRYTGLAPLLQLIPDLIKPWTAEQHGVPALGVVGRAIQDTFLEEIGAQEPVPREELGEEKVDFPMLAADPEINIWNQPTRFQSWCS